MIRVLELPQILRRNIGKALANTIKVANLDGVLSALLPTGAYALQIQGYGTKKGYVTKTAAYTALATDDTILVDATAGAITITLPAVASSAGVTLTVKKIDSSGNAVTLDGNASETIDGATTKALSAQWASLTIHCNGSAWYIVGELD